MCSVLLQYQEETIDNQRKGINELLKQVEELEDKVQNLSKRNDELEIKVSMAEILEKTRKEEELKREKEKKIASPVPTKSMESKALSPITRDQTQPEIDAEKEFEVADKVM